jgi:hypothetical protein
MDILAQPVTSSSFKLLCLPYLADQEPERADYGELR